MGVDRKQLAAMFRIWQMENRMAYGLTSKPENTKTNVRIHDRRKPVAEQAMKPMILCFQVRPHIYLLLPMDPRVKMLSLGAY